MEERQIVVAGRTVNLRKALPWTGGDWEDLETETGISPTRLSDRPTAKEIVSVVWAVLRKADPTVTRDEVRALEFAQYAVVLDVLNQEPDRPFSTPSTSLPVPTGGPSET